MPAVFGFDCFSPGEIAGRIENVGVTKAHLPFPSMAALGVLAGGFIGFGAMLFTLVVSDAKLSFAVARLLGGVTFSLGLILVVVAGAELFTGNNLLVMAWVARRISLGHLARNFAVVYLANFLGAVGLAALVALSGYGGLAGGAVGRTAVAIAGAKCALPVAEAFFKGVLCNLLVCLAIWIAMAGRTVTDKILAIVFPITAFVAAGFEHSVANMYFIPLGLMLGGEVGTAAGLTLPSWGGLVQNLIPVTLGNLVGGAGLVGVVDWFIYRRGQGNPSGTLRNKS